MRRPQHRFIERLAGHVRDYIADHPLCDCGDVARRVTEPALDGYTLFYKLPGLGEEYARAVLEHLVARGLVMIVPAPCAAGYLYVAYKMGECETCGVHDHHLALGQCPECVRRYWHCGHPFAQPSLERAL